jgi:hypothetical protein
MNRQAPERPQLQPDRHQGYTHGSSSNTASRQAADVRGQQQGPTSRKDVRYIEPDDQPQPSSGSNVYAVPIENKNNREITRRPSLKTERSAMFNTLERLKGGS